MECLTLTNEQWSQLINVLVAELFITVFLAVLAAFITWDALGWLVRRSRLLLRVRKIKQMNAN